MSAPAFAAAAPHVSACVSAWSPQDSGGLPAVGFDRDSEFAKRLAARGLQKHAEFVVARLGTSAGLTDEQKAALEYLKASVAMATFEAERDFEKAKAQYDTAKAALAAYIKAAPKGRFAAEASYDAGDLDRKMGEKVTAQIAIETNAEKIGELRKLGDAAFTAAINYFRDREAALKASISGNSANPFEDPSYVAAAYAIPNTYLTWAYLYPPGDAKRTDNLKRAGTYFEEFTLNCGDDKFIYYEAAIKWGNALRDQPVAGAEDVYNMALQLLYFTPDDPQQKKEAKEPGELLEVDRLVILNAACEIAKLYLVKQQYGEIATMYADCKHAIPDLPKFERGVELMLEVAKTYEAQGKKDLAKAEAKRVASIAPPGSNLWNAARELQVRLGEDLTRVDDLNDSQVYGPVQAALNEGKYADAIRAFQQMRDRLRGTPAEAKFEPGLLAIGGAAYRAAGRNLEAIVCWSHVGEKYPNNKDSGPKSLYSAVQAACQLWVTTKGSWAGELAHEAADKLQANFADHELTPEAQALVLATEAKVGGKPPLDLAKTYEEQIKSLQKTDPKYGRVTYEAGKKFYDAGVGAAGQKTGRVDREQARAGAERCWELYLDWAKAQNTLDASELQKIDERTVYIQQSRAQMWLWEPGANVEKTFGLLKDLEGRTTKSAAAKARALEFEQIKLRAYLQQGQLDKAIAVVEGMLTKAPDSPRTVASVKRIADAGWAELTKNFDKLSPERATQLIDWEIRYFREWVTAGAKIANYLEANDYNIAASRLFALGLYKNGLPPAWPGSFYLIDTAKFVHTEPTQLAADFYGKAIEVHGAGKPDFVIAVRIRRGACFGLLQRWKDLADDYKAVIAEASLVNPEGNGAYKLSASSELKKPELVILDCAYALCELAKKGDKAAGNEAEKLAAAVIVAVEPKGNQDPPFEFWYGRYIYVLGASANGERKVVDERIDYYVTTDKDLDKDKWGFRAKILALRKK